MVPRRAGSLFERHEAVRDLGRRRPGVTHLNGVNGHADFGGLAGDGGLDLGGEVGAVGIGEGSVDISNGVGNGLLGGRDEVEFAVGLAVGAKRDLGEVRVLGVDDGVSVNLATCNPILAMW